MRLGRFSPRLAQALAPGYGRCLRCKTPWKYVEPHVTDYSLNGGCFPLCEQCWAELSLMLRLRYYRELVDRWESDDRRERDWPLIMLAVLRGG